MVPYEWSHPTAELKAPPAPCRSPASPLPYLPYEWSRTRGPVRMVPPHRRAQGAGRTQTEPQIIRLCSNIFDWHRACAGPSAGSAPFQIDSPRAVFVRVCALLTTGGYGDGVLAQAACGLPGLRGACWHRAASYGIVRNRAAPYGIVRNRATSYGTVRHRAAPCAKSFVKSCGTVRLKAKAPL